MAIQEKNKINCPKCGEEIDVNDILYHQVDAQLKKQYKDELAKEKEKYSTQALVLEKERIEFDAEKASQKEKIDAKVKGEVKKKEIGLKKKIREEAEKEQLDAIGLLREELDIKSEKIKVLNKTTAELEKLKRKSNELEETLKAEAEKELNRKLVEEKKRIIREESDKNELKLKELEKKLEEQKLLTDEMKRKHDQGSMQSQGEIQELAIEEWLAEKFPLDEIQEIKKGERGADCLQIVHHADSA